MLRGSLDDFSLPDIFRLISLAKKTGRLQVQRKAGDGKLYFRDGEVYYAESSLSREPLGQKLIRSGALTEGQLRKALDKHSETGERVGDILVNSGTVTVEQIATAVSQQIEDSVFDLLRWELGDFEWENAYEVDVEIPISVSVENLIMEAARRLDELEVIKRKIPSMNVILAMAPKPPEGALEINITPEEWRVLVLVDGSRSVSDIAAMVGLDEFGAMRTMYGLVSAGLVEVWDSGEAHEAPSEAVSTSWSEGATEDLAAAEPLADEIPTEPEPIAEEPEPVAEEPQPEPPADEPVATEPVAEEPEPVAAEPEPVAAEPDAEAEFAIADAADAAVDDLLEEAAAEEAAAEEALESFDADSLPDALDVEPVAASETVPEGILDEPEIPVETFDAPGPDELVMEIPSPPEAEIAEPDAAAAIAAEAEPAADRTGGPDSFLDDLLDEEAATPPPAPPEDAPSPRVDRAAVVRELAGLFSDEERAAAKPKTPPPPRPGAPRAEDDDRKRVEDDDQVTKGLISRLIDGVKGL